MSERITKLTTALLWALMGLTVIFAIFFYVGGDVAGTEGTRYAEPKITNSFIVFAYILFALAVLFTLFFTVRNFVLNPSSLKLTLVVVIAGAVIMGVAALLADNTVLNLPHYKGNDNVPTTLFWTDVGLYMAYFLLGLAFLAIIYTVVSKYFKK